MVIQKVALRALSLIHTLSSLQESSYKEQPLRQHWASLQNSIKALST